MIEQLLLSQGRRPQTHIVIGCCPETAFVCMFLYINDVQKYLYITYTHVQTIQNYTTKTETAFVCFLNVQTIYKLYRMYTNLNRIIYAPTDVAS